jgi:hypothetical protein
MEQHGLYYATARFHPDSGLLANARLIKGPKGKEIVIEF